MGRGPTTLLALRGFVARNRDRHPVTESFPQAELRSLRREDCDDSIAALLVELARLALAYGKGPPVESGEDLLNLASVVEAIGSMARADRELIELLRRTLADHHREEYRQVPARGSLDPDRYDRARALERAEDFLTESVVCTLACLGEAAAPAVPEVEQAERHRSLDVQYVARSLAARLGRKNRTVSGSIPRDTDGEGGV